MSSIQFNIADFLHRLTIVEVAGCEGCMTEEEIQQALKTVGKDKSPRTALRSVAHVCVLAGDNL